MNASLARAIKTLGSQDALAVRMGVRQSTVSEWLREERPIPQERCAEIERCVDGAESCEQLRPDLAWERIPDKDWPWHPKGRPVIDVTKEVA